MLDFFFSFYLNAKKNKFFTFLHFFPLLPNFRRACSFLKNARPAKCTGFFFLFFMMTTRVQQYSLIFFHQQNLKIEFIEKTHIFTMALGKNFLPATLLPFSFSKPIGIEISIRNVIYFSSI